MSWVLLTSSTPCRGAGSALALTRYVSDSLPWPEVGVTAIHAAFVVAVHVQSRLVEIASVPDMPPAGAAPVAAFSTVTTHLAAVGAVTEIADDDPVHALARHPSAHSPNSRARMARVHGANGLPSPAAFVGAALFPFDSGVLFYVRRLIRADIEELDISGNHERTQASATVVLSKSRNRLPAPVKTAAIGRAFSERCSSDVYGTSSVGAQAMRTLLGGGRPSAWRDQLRPVSADT